MTTGQTILCGRVVTPFRIIEQGMVIVRGKRIAYAGDLNVGMIAADSRVLQFDDPGTYITPGFFDIHCHGGGGVSGYDDPETFADFHLRHGTTSILPTFVYNQSHAHMMESLDRVQSFMSRRQSSIVGIHMEGPYINPKYGAVIAPIRPVNPAEYREILQAAGRTIKLWTLAPELEGQRQFMEEASAHGIVFSVGHSEAAPETIFEAHRFGLRVGCHLTNASGATPDPTRYAGTRELGVHEAVLLHDDMYAEVIPDKDGIHVRPLMLRLIVKTKGADQVIIITDYASRPSERAGDDAERDVRMLKKTAFTLSDPASAQDEMLSGSLLTMDRAVHNMRNHTGVGMVDACKMAALNPARLLGMDRDIGSIERGKLANLLVVSEAMQVKMVMLEGRMIG